MRRLFLISAICFLALTANAQVSSNVSAGDKNLDGFLTNLAKDYAAGRMNKQSFIDELKFNFGLSSGDFNALMTKGYNAGDAYLLGMLRKRSGKSLEDLIRNRRPGQGWGELAHELGIHPSELNKMRVAMKKQWKEQEKGKKRGKYGLETPEHEQGEHGLPPGKKQKKENKK